MMNRRETIKEKYAVLDYSPLGQSVLDENLKVLFWNRTLELWTGIGRDTIVGASLNECFPNLQSQNYMEYMNMVLKNGIPIVLSPQIHKYIIPAPLPDGRFRHQYTIINRIPSLKKDCFHLLIILQDVTTLSEAIEKYRKFRTPDLRRVRTINTPHRKTL